MPLRGFAGSARPSSGRAQRDCGGVATGLGGLLGRGGRGDLHSATAGKAAGAGGELVVGPGQAGRSLADFRVERSQVVGLVVWAH